jgi:hypothetical protein
MKHPLFTLLTLAGLIAGTASVSAQTGPKPVPATPENAAAFLGTWTIETTGSYGPANLEATVKAADGKVSGEVSSATTGKAPMTDISKSGGSLVFVYVFDYNGMPITAVVTLTPGDKKVDAYVDMADGAAQFTGTATKKDKE